MTNFAGDLKKHKGAYFTNATEVNVYNTYIQQEEFNLKPIVLLFYLFQ